MPAEIMDTVPLLKRLYDTMAEPVCARHGITRMELDILLFLANNPGYDTANALVRRRGLAKSHVSSSVKTLTARGWLTACYQDGNRKTVHLRLCAAARDAVAEGQATQRRFMAALLDGFSPAELAALDNVLLRMQQNLQAALQEKGTI